MMELLMVEGDMLLGKLVNNYQNYAFDTWAPRSL